jgi:Mrp family chromosome partitioning ATPase
MKRATAAGFLSGETPLPAEALAAYRLLADDLFGQEDLTLGRESTILIAGPAPAPSKTVTAVSLGMFAAGAGRRTIVVDADFRQPEVARAFNLEDGGPDLADLLAGHELSDVLRSVDGSEGWLSVVPLNARGAEKLASGRLDGFDPLGRKALTRRFEELREQAEIIVVNGPTGAEGAELVPYALAADGALINIELGITSQKRLEGLLQTLEEHGAKITGFVLFTRARARGGGGRPAYPDGTASDSGAQTRTEVVKRLPVRKARTIDPNA